MTKRKIYEWMDEQIVACDIQTKPLKRNDPFFVKNASSTENEIHVYHIDNLCKLLGKSYKIAEHSDAYEEHYFMYNGHTFFGLERRS